MSLRVGWLKNSFENRLFVNCVHDQVWFFIIIIIMMMMMMMMMIIKIIIIIIIMVQ